MIPKTFSEIIDLGDGREIKLETGKLAKQAHGSVVVQKIKEGKKNFGFNAKTLEFEDLFKAGVVDPKKVVRVALENASSAAAMFLTTETVVVDDESEEDNSGGGGRPAGGMGAMGGGMGMPGM